MDSRAEGHGAPESVGVIFKRLLINRRAREFVEAEMLNGRTFARKEAIGLCVMYSAYVRELWEGQLLMAHLNGNKHDEGWRKESSDRRMQVDEALIEAENGDFKKLKVFVAGLSNEDVSVSKDEERSDEVREKLKAVAARLRYFSRLMPDNGAPVKLPLPAYKDPRFNPDTSPPPPDLAQS